MYIEQNIFIQAIFVNFHKTPNPIQSNKNVKGLELCRTVKV